MRVVVATRSGIAVVEDGEVTDVVSGDVRCLARTGTRIYAGTNGAGVLRSDDGGVTWRTRGLEGLAVRSLAAEGDRVLAGVQPVGVHRSDDAGESWRLLDTFPRRPYWWQPDQPPHRQGYVSALAVAGEAILAGVEAFRGFRSIDGGSSWHAMRRGFTRDCHALVLAHGQAYVGAGLGPSWSMDGGATWRQVRSGLDRRYVMAIEVDPADPSCWYVGAAPLLNAHTADSRARIFRFAGGGWSPVSEELRELPHALACPEPECVVAGLRNGLIRVSSDRGSTWWTLAELDRVRAVV
jgi:hypothetical protein